MDFGFHKVSSSFSKDVLTESKRSFLGREDVSKDETIALTVTNDVDIGLSEIIDIKKFSSLYRFVNVISYVFRFINNVKKKIRKEETQTNELITLEEYNHSLLHILKDHQQDIKHSPSFSKLQSSLKLFEDNGLLRLRGRFQNSTISDDQKFPIFIDSQSWLSTLIIWHAHESVLHHGIESTLNFLRKRYWITSGRKTVKNILRKCITCKKFQGKTMLPPQSPDLSDFRLNLSIPFNATGLDFAVPLFVKNNFSSNCQKVYILLLTCATSRAIHLELVPDLKSDSFIRGFQRFISRRGTPSMVINDNAKTFRSRETKSFLKRIQVNQKFILPASPWWGGFYERLVRSVKTSIKKILGRSLITAEELQTVLCQVEAVINARPLCYVNEDDLEEPLTPNHLMYGRNILNSTNQFLSSSPKSSKDVGRRVVYLRSLLEKFRKRFHRSYLNELRQIQLYRKSKSANSSLSLNDVVLIKDDKPLPRNEWRIGRVIELIKGRDGLLRGAKLRTIGDKGSKTITHRPLQKLIPFEISDTEHTSIEPNETHCNSDIEIIAHDQHAQSNRPRRKTAVEGQYIRRLRKRFT